MRFDRLALPFLIATLTAACGIDSQTSASELFGPGAGAGGNAAKGGASGATAKGGSSGNGTAGASEGGSAGGISKGGSAGTASKGGSGGNASTGGADGAGAKGGSAGAPPSGGAAGKASGGSEAGGSDAGGTSAGGANAGGSTAGEGGNTSAGNGGSSTAGDGGSTSAGSGGSSTAGDGGSTSAGSGGSATAGNGGSSPAGNGGTSAGNGGTSAGNGGTSAGNGGSSNAGSGGAAGGTTSKCGDGKIDEGEECDGTVGTSSSVACDASCKLLCDVPGVAFRDQQSKTCFFLLKGDFNWEAARKACEQVPKSRLATFEGDGMRPRIHFGFKPEAGAVYWVGAFQDDPPCCLGGENDKWKWRAPGNPGIGSENWSKDEPNDKDDWEGGEEDCGEARADDTFKMNDTNCESTKHSAICQRPVL